MLSLFLANTKTKKDKSHLTVQHCTKIETILTLPNSLQITRWTENDLISAT